MTKLSAIVVTKRHLQAIQDQERDVIWRFLTEHLRGINEQMHARWARWWRRLWKMDDDEAAMLYIDVPRSLRFHKRWMAIEDRLFLNQDYFGNKKAFRLWLKTGAALGEYFLGKNRFGADCMVFVPASVQFEDCSDDEMREFCADAIEFLRSERAQRKLWPHLQPEQRADMVEVLLVNPKDGPK